MTTALGEKLRRRRKARGLTLAALAEAVGSSKSYIWELENKAPPRPSADILSRLARELEVTIDYLLDEGGEIREDDAKDQAFFRKYREMSEEEKERFRKMIDLWESK